MPWPSASRPRQPDWDSLAQTLAPLLTPETLIVQSTDFSHYLPAAEARGKDQETLRVLSGGDPAGRPGAARTGSSGLKSCPVPATAPAEAGFSGPAHGHRQPQFPGTTPPSLVQKTTSYIVQLYSAKQLARGRDRTALLRRGHLLWPLSGEKLSRAKFREKLVAKVLKITGGARLIVNLEGVIMPGGVREVGPYDLCMDSHSGSAALTEAQGPGGHVGQ